jgi:hypothetical protein
MDTFWAPEIRQGGQNNIDENHKETGSESVDKIRQLQDRTKCRTAINTSMILKVNQRLQILLIADSLPDFQHKLCSMQ